MAWNYTTAASAPIPEPDGTLKEVVKGDLNGDGKITVQDAIAALRYAVGRRLDRGEKSANPVDLSTSPAKEGYTSTRRTAMPLTNEEIEEYRENGFIIKRHLFSRDYVDRLSAEIDGLHEKMAADAPPTVHVSWEEGLEEGRPPRIRQLMHSEKVSPILASMVRSEEILGIMAQLIGPDVYLFHSKLMMKAARDGTFTPWHQDWGYWRHGSKEPTQINCMLAIDPNTEENGAIRFVNGSHLQGAIDHTNFKSASFSIGLEGDIDAFEATLCEMEPGDAIFFGPLVVHGSAPNRSPLGRRANTFAYDRPNNQLEGELPSESLCLKVGKIV